MSFKFDVLVVLAALGLALTTGTVRADTPGYAEKVVQWTVKSGESCEDISVALYGSASHKALVQRYNSVACTPGAALKVGLTLVLPAKVTTLPTAKITSVNPDTRARPGGGGWANAYVGQPLTSSSSVNTREEGRAGIQFIDRTRIYLASNTLVVIYGTAAQSQVSKQNPVAVELKSGELQAGLAALRGRPLSIDVEGGGRVDATSTDAVVHKQGQRTNVAVFHGTANVSNAGASVNVPTNYGTRFFEQKAPEKPRPLPPAPLWEPGGSSAVVFDFDQAGVLTAAWKPVEKAAQYRIEVARDDAFTDLVIRQQVPARVLSFRAEKLPLGSYHLRVRAIDGEDFLGIASTTRSLEMIAAGWSQGGGKLTPDGLEVGRYAILRLDPAAAAHVGLDDAPLGGVPASIDFRRLAPRTIRVQGPSSEQKALAIRYIDPEASLALRRDGRNVHVTLTFRHVEGLDVARVLAPKATASFEGGTLVVPLTLSPAGTFVGTATLPPATTTYAIAVRDDFGHTLASRQAEPGAAPPPPPDQPLPPPPAEPHYRLGALYGAMGFSPRTSVLWTSPSALNHGTLGVRVDSVGDPLAVQGYAHAEGAIGPVGLDASIFTPATEDARVDSSAWLGLRYRAYRTSDHGFEIGPVMRFGFPLDDIGPPARLEPSLALGGAGGDWTWLVNLGGRLRLSGPPEERTFVDAVQAFVIAGGSFDPTSWLRLSANIDFHALAPGARQAVLGRGGLSLGVEAGQRFFVSIGGRVTPWDDVGAGLVAGQLGLGFREL